MKWVLVFVFINASGGVAVDRVPMATEAHCANAIKALSAGVFESVKGVALAGATCFETGQK